MTDADVVYTAEATSAGDGRNGHVRTADGTIDLDMAVPTQMGGSGDGANPEQLFASGYAACFHSALQGVARRGDVALGDSRVDARVDMVRDGGFSLAVTLEVTVPELAHDEAVELAEQAHRACPYSKATRGNIDVQVHVTDDWNERSAQRDHHRQ